MSLGLVIPNTSQHSLKRPQQSALTMQQAMRKRIWIAPAMSNCSGMGDLYDVGWFLVPIFGFDQSKKNKGAESVPVSGLSETLFVDGPEVDAIGNGKGSFILQSVVERILGGTTYPTNISHLTKAF